MATAQTRWLFSSWKLSSDHFSNVFTTPTSLKNTLACWKIREKKKKVNLKASSGAILFSLFYCCLFRESQSFLLILLPLCHSSDRGWGPSFCTESCCSFVVQVRNMGARLSQTILVFVWIKSRRQLCGGLLCKAEILECSLQRCEKRRA